MPPLLWTNLICSSCSTRSSATTPGHLRSRKSRIRTIWPDNAAISGCWLKPFSVRSWKIVCLQSNMKMTNLVSSVHSTTTSAHLKSGPLQHTMSMFWHPWPKLPCSQKKTILQDAWPAWWYCRTRQCHWTCTHLRPTDPWSQVPLTTTGWELRWSYPWAPFSKTPMQSQTNVG